MRQLSGVYLGDGFQHLAIVLAVFDREDIVGVEVHILPAARDSSCSLPSCPVEARR